MNIISSSSFAARSPELHGIANERFIANQGVEAWSDKSFSFSELPSFLKGATFFKTAETILTNSNLNIFIYRPSTVFIALMGNPGGLNLQTKGWKEFTGSHNVMARLSNLYMKRVTQNGPTRITMGTLSSDFTGVIFVRGNE